MDNYKSMFESWISASAVEKLPEAKAPGKLETNTGSSWPYGMEGHAKKCGKMFRICELKKLSRCEKSQRHVWMTTNLKKKNLDQL